MPEQPILPPSTPAAPAVSPAPPRRLGLVKLLLLVILLFSSGFYVGRYLLPAAEFAYDNPLQFVTVENGERRLIFPIFWEAWDKLHQNYIGQLEEKDLYYGAVAGMVQAADDPYTVFSPPAATKQFEETIQGSFSGIGIELGFRNGLMTVISPLEGSPAQKAGMRQGDIIVAVNDEPITADSSLDQVVQQIRGEKDEPVKITVIHEGEEKTTDITVVREKIEITSVKLEVTDGIAHLIITNFNSDTAKRFSDAARQIQAAGAKAVILDVRNNPGGFLESAVEIASHFLPRDTLVVSEKGKNDKRYTTRGPTDLAGLPVSVLINGGSASASEILAGALRDHLNTPIVGNQSFGKGSVQEFMKLSDGSSLRVTIARWYTPNGTSIADEGIKPTIEVSDDRNTPVDEQLERAKEEMRLRLSPNENHEA